jgi:hypothetical protein
MVEMIVIVTIALDKFIDPLFNWHQHMIIQVFNSGPHIAPPFLTS